jgi:erythromycin esterase
MTAMSATEAPDLLDEALDLATPFTSPADLDPLLARTEGSRVVLIGEASHGTSEYYRWRAELTRRLIEEQGFSIVAVEGDWPDCARIDRWVRGDGPGSAEDVLRTFERWPTWMWANREVETFASWLREHNAARPASERVGFHGLDVYSLWDSLRSILDYLDEHDGDAAAAARRAWGCFEPFDEDPQEYAWATKIVPTSCEEEVVDLLAGLVGDAVAVDGDGPDVRFDAEQNAAVVAGAERYYRAMVRGGGQSWNVRDHHMADTLDRLLEHRGPGAKAVVWEHNTHVGDARFTDMAAAGMVNVGQLARERHGEDDVVLVGMGGYEGTVVAASAWGEPHEVMEVPPARPRSHEALLHRAGLDQALLLFPDELGPWLTTPAGHRAIGVVYRSALERAGNWVPTVLGRRYDAFLYFDRTRALTPIGAEPEQLERPEEAATYPTGR